MTVAVAVLVVLGTGLAVVAVRSSTWSGRFSLSSPDRAAVARVALHQWRARLVTGVGPGRALFLWTDANRAVYDRYAHDEYLQLAVEEGLVGLAGLAALLGGVATVALAGLAAAATWAERTSPERLWRRRRLLPDLGRGPAAVALAILGWDFIYYWNHRLMHESRHLWAIHVVHHSSERYNLSTALRQPVADTLGTSVPYGLLCLVGLSPELVATARGVNLLYQFWIHTETIGRLGAPEVVLNSPSHHRVHHGSNPPYLDRNHGSILIVWDRLFGTFEPEGEAVVYGLTKDIKTFNPGRIATHELAAMVHDVARSDGWGERLSHVLRGPGWGTARESTAAGASGPPGPPTVDAA